MEDVKEVSGDGIIHEVPVGKGLSGALKLLHDRGTLKESINWGGRNMDKKKSKLVGIVDNDDGKGKEKKNKDKDMDRFEHVSLERTDEFGRTVSFLSSLPLLLMSFAIRIRIDDALYSVIYL
ncbi:SART-1 family protein DOT2 [Linum perenne]